MLITKGLMMLTLDEVIIGIREQIGLGDPILIDALYYLKEYRQICEVLNSKVYYNNCSVDYQSWRNNEDA